MTTVPSVHPILNEADRQAEIARHRVIADEFTRLQARITELETENARLKAAPSKR